MNFNEKNAHPRDPLLTFCPEDHTYHFGDRILRPVTSVVESCFKPFDVDYWAPRKAAQLGISEAELRRQWEEKGRCARDAGTAMHAAIEHYYLGEPLADFDTRHLFRAFEAGNPLNPYRTEWSVFDEDSGIAGTIDFLEYNNGVFRIFDWKRSDKIIYNGKPVLKSAFAQTGIGALSSVPDTTFWHYALQVSIYRYILGRKYGINVESCHLVVLHPNYDVPYLLTTPYLEPQIRALFHGK